MAGGIAILLLIVVLLVAVGIALALYATSGFPRRDRPSADAEARGGADALTSGPIRDMEAPPAGNASTQ